MAKTNTTTREEFDADERQPEGIDPEAAQTALDEFLKDAEGNQDDGVTAPQAVMVNKSNKSLDAIRKAIEKLIKPKWDSSESSRLLDCSTLSEKFTLKDIKTALIPYVRKGWFATVTLPDKDRRNVLLTYEASIEFITTGKWGGNEQGKDIYVRLYPKEPSTVPYICKIYDPSKRFGPIALLVSLVGGAALAVLFSPVLALAGVCVSGIVAFLMATYAGNYASIRAKGKMRKVFGPLIFVDDIRGCKTTHKTVTRNERIQYALDRRILETED